MSDNNTLLGRLKAEKEELDSRVAKLCRFLGSAAFFRLNEEMQFLLESQVAAMSLYSDILARRITLLGDTQ